MKYTRNPVRIIQARIQQKHTLGRSVREHHSAAEHIYKKAHHPNEFKMSPVAGFLYESVRIIYVFSGHIKRHVDIHVHMMYVSSCENVEA